MSLPTLTVKLDGPTLMRGTVSLNGVELAGLTDLDIAMSVEGVTRATFGVYIGRLDIDAKTLAMLAATVRATEPEPVAAPDEPELRTFGEEPSHA